MNSNLPRRRFLAGFGAAAGATAAAAGAAPTAGALSFSPKEEPKEAPPLLDDIIPFDGRHQAGISTAQQAHAWFIAFDIKEGVGREELGRLMRVWTDSARRMTQGIPAPTDLEPEMLFSVAGLTITVGFGRQFFAAAKREDLAPEWLGPLPEYQHDQLRDEWNDGDILLQICCDDPMTLSHVSRFMIKDGATYVTPRWTQIGFLHARGSFEPGQTPRNRFGQLDGTVNPRTEEEYDRIVWIQDGPQHLRGGTSLVLRRIEMDIDGWDILDRGSREEVAGRRLDTGAPLGQENEHDPADLSKTDEYGLPVIDPRSHMARSMPEDGKPGLQMLRRPYQYDLPPDPNGRFTSNTGLIFAAYQKDPLLQYHTVQLRLDEADRLNEWIFHIGSAVFFIPHGVDADGWWGQDILED
ncbi:Dyp-type peroxidase [Corynebacterium sp.]|uniref:Dyp-type peroxidase n=1 Tax=Corynebacterium sp. TaxID=1720 RepID=UPI0026DA78ED|nr:Dyp-type peroxidase [Corynebacterium sp.]MDO4609481.1 Dyp-type peroxidase [Corynebacterium sp.]